MKKTLVALAVLGSFAGVASAATSVTLYGTVDAGYEGWSYGKDFSGYNSTFVQGSGAGPVAGSKSGNSEGNSKIGVKGQEDLGNGLAATFQLEGEINGDTGSSNLFNKESTVGLKGAFGEVKFGRSKSQMELALGGVVPGHRVADVDLYSVVSSRHSNGLFYSYDNAGFSFGADVTTKGGALGNDNEGVKGEKVGWGVRAGYAGNVGGNVTLLARAAYQRDGVVLLNDKQQYEAGGLLAAVIPYSNNALTVGVAYSQGRGWAEDLVTAKANSAAKTLAGRDPDTGRVYADKARTWSGVIASTFGPNDSAYLKYQQRKGKLDDGSVAYNGNVWAVGYEHALSKRTSVYADVAYATIKQPTVSDKGTATGYSVGLSHSF